MLFRRILWFYHKKCQLRLRVANTTEVRAVATSGMVELLLTLRSANGSAPTMRTVSNFNWSGHFESFSVSGINNFAIRTSRSASRIMSLFLGSLKIFRSLHAPMVLLMAIFGAFATFTSKVCSSILILRMPVFLRAFLFLRASEMMSECLNVFYNECHFRILYRNL